MKNILVANPKGGSGKTTIATNLAGYFAAQGYKVMLSDLDRQQSSTYWLATRPANYPTIMGQTTKDKSSSEKSANKVQFVISDSPGGFRDEKLSEAVKQADCIIVPVQPSAFDIGATQDFLDVLIAEKAIRKNKTFIALVGMRVNYRTHAALKLVDFLEQTNLPVLAYLRNAQVYVTAAEQGLSLFDMRPSQVAQDVEQWQPMLDWIAETTK
jgi:chromosome partitioning protein